MTSFEEQLGSPRQALQLPTSSCSTAVQSGTGAIVQAHGGNRPLRGADAQQTTLMLFLPKQLNARYQFQALLETRKSIPIE